MYEITYWDDEALVTVDTFATNEEAESNLAEIIATDKEETGLSKAELKKLYKIIEV